MSRFKCLASKSMPKQGPYLRHVCESLPGSSGGILFNTRTGAVGLHHSGGLDKNDPDSFNKGTLLARLVTTSKTLKKLTGRIAKTNPAKTAPAINKTIAPATGKKNAGNSGRFNDILNNALGQ